MDVKPSTLKAYNGRLKTLAKRLGVTDFQPERINEWITVHGFNVALENVKFHSRHPYVIAVIYYLDKESDLFKEFDKLRREIKDSLELETESRVYKKTDIERQRWKAREDLNICYEKYLKMFNENPTRDLMVLLFYLYPFHDIKFGVLRNDLATLRINTDGNTIDLENRKIVLMDHKNSREKGEEVYPIPDELLEIIKKWIEVNDLKDGDYFIDISKNNISHVLKKWLGMSTSLLRKINQTELHGETFKGLDEAEKTAKLQGHSVKVVRKHYIKTD